MYIFRFIVCCILMRLSAAIPIRCLMHAPDKMGDCVSELNKLAQRMERVFLTDDKITCNDGSKAGYYIRENPKSEQWIIYLEGGWFCHNEASCTTRMNHSSLFSMTSSKLWQEYRNGDGMLHPRSDMNPLFYNYNHVYVPYCSSDFWLGNTNQVTSVGGEIAFHGSKILMKVITELLNQRLIKASLLILAGSSAGGIGVLQNVDRVAKIVQKLKPDMEVRGVIDSAYFLEASLNPDCKSDESYGCNNSHLQLKLATRYWDALLDPSCDKGYRCLFAENMLHTLDTPIFMFQWLYDTVQIMADNRALETHLEEIFQAENMAFILKLGEKMRELLKASDEKHGLFAPSCISHTALTSCSVFQGIKIHGVTLNQALQCWLNEASNKTRAGKYANCKQRLTDKCPAMSCQKDCPTIYHPTTGEEVEIPMSSDQDSDKIMSEQDTHNFDFLNKIMKDLKTG